MCLIIHSFSIHFICLFIFQHVESPQHYVLIFELMEGGDLWNYLRGLAVQRQETGASGPGSLPLMALPEEETRSVFQQVK